MWSCPVRGLRTLTARASPVWPYTLAGATNSNRKLFSGSSRTRRSIEVDVDEVKPKGRSSTDTMKRAATAEDNQSKVKKRRIQPPEYHATPSHKDEAGEIVWPAPRDQLQTAKEFIRECAAAGKKTLIAPDKDADGLTSGAILQKTLVLLGLDESLIEVHLLQRESSIHDITEREAMAVHSPEYIIVLDQGSRKSPALIEKPHKALIVDHHHALDEDFPAGSQHVTACDCPPVATSSLLTYLICRDLHEDVERQCGWLCAVGTHGDLGASLKWKPPFPDMEETFRRHKKTHVTSAISLLNGPRRSAGYNVSDAWDALTRAQSPRDLLTNEKLLAARAEVNAEVQRCTHTAPKFSADGRVAVFRMSSRAQIHPLIAQRWAGHLRSSKLEVIMAANEGYQPGFVRFSCRIAQSAKARDQPVNIIDVLNDMAARATDKTLRARLGESFARGHKEASGGVVPIKEFEELIDVMGVGKKPEGGSPKKTAKEQGNRITNYFGKTAY